MIVKFRGKVSGKEDGSLQVCGRAFEGFVDFDAGEDDWEFSVATMTKAGGGDEESVNGKSHAIISVDDPQPSVRSRQNQLWYCDVCDFSNISVSEVEEHEKICQHARLLAMPKQAVEKSSDGDGKLKGEEDPIPTTTIGHKQFPPPLSSRTPSGHIALQLSPNGQWYPCRGISTPQNNDVLCGRGGGSNSWVGNLGSGVLWRRSSATTRRQRNHKRFTTRIRWYVL